MYFTEPPDKPKDVIISDIESRSASLLWSPPYFGNSLITTFEINCKPADVAWESEKAKIYTVDGSLNMIRLRELTPAATYEVRLRCENALGWSDYSAKAHFITAEEGRQRGRGGVY